MIYADNAATTQMDVEAYKSMKQMLEELYGNASQPYKFSRPLRKALVEARTKIANCINANPEEIYFTSGGTESDNWAIKGSLAVENVRVKNIITSDIEHHAVLNSCSSMQALGYSVSRMAVNNKGILEPKTLQQSINKDTKLVSVMLANNEIGSIQKIRELAAIAHEAGALFHTDAVQAVGHIPIDVKKLDIDMLAASGHKFNGPKGIGFLYVRKGTNLRPFMNGGSQENGMRAGTENIPAIVAMAIALENNSANMESNKNKLNDMKLNIKNKLNSAGVEYILNGSNECLPGLLSLSFKNISGEMLLHRLDLKGICIATGSACDSVNTQISHVIQAIDIPSEYAKGTIRISLGSNNSMEESDIIASSIIDIVNSVNSVNK